MKRLTCLAAWIGSLCFCAAALADGDSKAGRRVAIEHCTRCHVVGDANPHGGINSTPSFQLLAKRNDWRERFQTFYARRPHPVFVRVPDVPRWTKLPSHVEPFDVNLEDIENLLSFVETLVSE